MLITKIEDPPSVDGSEGLLAMVFRYSSLDLHQEVPIGVTPQLPADNALQLLTVKYRAGHQIQAHHHPEFDRVSNSCQEVLLVVAGQLVCTIYNRRRQFVQEVVLSTHDIIVLLGGGHSFKIQQDTVLLEIRNGPFIVAKDKVRWVDGG